MQMRCRCPLRWRSRSVFLLTFFSLSLFWLSISAAVAFDDTYKDWGGIILGFNSVGCVRVNFWEYGDKYREATVILPRVQFIGDIDQKALLQRIASEFNSKEVTFFMYKDSSGEGALNRNGRYFASNFSVDLGRSYFDILRSLGYRLKVSKIPPYEEQDYMREIDAVVTNTFSRYDADKRFSSPSPNAGDSAKEKSLIPALEAFSGASPLLTRLLLAIRGGTIPPSIRQDKGAVAAFFKSMKNKLYEGAPPRLDAVRWASGKVGVISSDGRIPDATCEGQRLTLQIPVPSDPSWSTSERIARLSGQPCEYAFQRDDQGRERIEDGAHILSDMYLHDRRTTWTELLASEGFTLPLSTNPALPVMPIKLRILPYPGVWKKLLTPVIGEISFPQHPPELKETEHIRLPPLEFGKGAFAEAARKVDEKAIGQPVTVFLLISPDGKPYTELGQKRAARILFPNLDSSLDALTQQK